MAIDNSLFSLIKSLSKSEKRYFKIQSQKQKSRHAYMALFEEIEKHKTYDEGRIKQKLAGVIPVSGFAFTKSYLRKMIFKALESYTAEESVDLRIHNYISQCKILFKKELYPQYFKTMKKAKQLALEYERFGYYLELLEMDKMISRKQELRAITGSELQEAVEDVMAKISAQYGYSKIIRGLFWNYRETGTSRLPEHGKLIDNILAEKLMQSPANSLSSRGKLSYYRIMYLVHKMNVDYDGALEAAESQLKLIESNPEPFEDYIINFKWEAMDSVLHSHINLRNFERAEGIIARMKAEKFKKQSDRSWAMVSIISAEFEIAIQKFDIPEIRSHTDAIEQLLIDYDNKLELDFELMLHFRLIAAHIICGDFPRALKRANLLLAHPLLITRSDLVTYTGILYLIIHFELKNFELMPYLVRSAYRKLLKSEKLFRLESVLLSFLRKLTKVKSEEDFEHDLFLLRSEMTKLSTDKYEKNAFQYFDFLWWIDRKVQNF